MSNAPKRRNTRLAGHALPDEGRIRDDRGRLHNGVGPAQCSCGERSDALDSTAERKRWHYRHKFAQALANR